ncbi:uncharacterized protein LOC128656047 isoform X2 [Bombina bombina]|uniref:uncharacterized protein LOC128656047 isoform X2 n=1 Tax=Bombina bombina TaxID=8345 RepID=UPI00235A7965|nr:uncharacterized protein LOC128656047 isoform X2 [Bombina bombina]
MDSLSIKCILLSIVLFPGASGSTIFLSAKKNSTVNVTTGQKVTLIMNCTVTNFVEFRVQNTANNGDNVLLSTDTFGDKSDEFGKYTLHVNTSYVAFTINKVEEMNLVRYSLCVELRTDYFLKEVTLTANDTKKTEEIIGMRNQENTNNHRSELNNVLIPIFTLFGLIAGVAFGIYCVKKRGERPVNVQYSESQLRMIRLKEEDGNPTVQESTSEENSQLQPICNTV